MNYKIYEKITFLLLILAYFCMLFKVSIFFKDCPGNLFYIAAAITCRIYYVKNIKELRKQEQTEITKKKIDDSIGLSFVAPLMIGVVGFGLLIGGLLD